MLMRAVRTTTGGAASFLFGWGRPSRCHQGLITPRLPIGRSATSWSRGWNRRAQKTLGDLTEVFEEKSFAIALLLLMITSALPIPTGGITHGVRADRDAARRSEMIFGRRTIWLPQRLLRRELGPATTTKAIPFIARRVRFFERFARPRLAGVLDQRVVLSALGVIILLFTLRLVRGAAVLRPRHVAGARRRRDRAVADPGGCRDHDRRDRDRRWSASRSRSRSAP